MSSPANRPHLGLIPARYHVALGAAVLTLATFAAYHRSFAAPFVFDDVPGIVENTSIRHLWPIGDVLAPRLAGGITVSGRPIVNLSFALNYAFGGDNVAGFHFANLLIHLAAGLILFGLVRRTLVLNASAGASEVTSTHPAGWATPSQRGPSTPVVAGFFVAALWLLHPLQTESVTYVVQRAESLAGFFYLLTLYAFVRAVSGEKNVATSPVSAALFATPLASRLWLAGSVTACALGMASKEVCASAPLIVLVYDRTFVAGSFRAAWQARGKFYLVLAATWFVLGWLVIGGASRGGTAGFATGMSPWHYALTQCRAIVHYLALTFWPHALTFDYGMATVNQLTVVWSQTLALTALLAATTFALWRAPVVGFLGAWFFALLAPTSSFVPVVTQTMAEHRMYLPLAGVVTLTVVAAFNYLNRGTASLGCTIAALVLGLVTNARNLDYRSNAVLWADTAAKLPTNARAHNNLGQALFRSGQIAAAKQSYERALALQPKYPETHYNLGSALAGEGNLPLAMEQYELALRFEPNYPEAHSNLGNALVKLGRVPEAVSHYEAALRIKPDFAEAQSNLGNAQLQLGDTARAIASFQRALQLKPNYPEALYNLGNAFAATGQMPAALDQYQRALALEPNYADAHVNTGNVLLQLDRTTEALAHYEKAVALDPRLAEAHYDLGSVLLQLERWSDAALRFEILLRLTPDAANAHRALGFALMKLGRPAEAIPHYEQYVRAVPNDTTAREELAQLRREAERKP